MPYGRTIATYVPLLVAVALVSLYFASLRQAMVGCAIGILLGVIIGWRGVRMLRSHILKRKRGGFSVKSRPMGILLIFVLPLMAGMGLGFLYQFQPWLVLTAVVAGSSGIAAWWLVMGSWVWRIERRTGRDIVMLADGFHLASRRRNAPV